MAAKEENKNPLTRKIITALVSIVVAFALWMYVVTVVGPEYKDTFRDIPVSFVGLSTLQEKGFMLIVEETPTVTLELSGNRSDLNKLSAANITVTVDLSKIERAGKNALNYNVSYPMNVSQESITVQNGSPAGIQVEIVKRITREIPVYVETVGTMPADYIKEKPQVEMETIRISGPEDVVEKISGAWIWVELTEDSKSTVTGAYTYTLCDENKEPVDAKYIQVAGEEAQTITVTIPIKRVKEIPLVLNLVPGGGASIENTAVTIQPATIQISGSEAALEGLEMLELGTIDLGTITTDMEKTYTIVLPEGITNESGLQEATVTIGFPQLETKTFLITNVQTVNPPAGLTVTVKTQIVAVTIRGPKRELDKLTEADISVTVDCTGAEVGSQRFEATVQVKDNTAVGAIGEYDVLVLVEES